MRFARDLSDIVSCIFGLAFALLAPLPVATAQDAKPVEPPATQDQPGLLNDISKLLKSPADLLPSFTKPDAPAAEAPPPPAPQPPPVATGSRAPPPDLPKPYVPKPDLPKESSRLIPAMVSGRELCPVGSNGAPDCQTGSDRLCQSKGYKTGKSLNMDTAFSCSARIARATGGKACGNEHFVTSAFCN